MYIRRSGPPLSPLFASRFFRPARYRKGGKEEKEHFCGFKSPFFSLPYFPLLIPPPFSPREKTAASINASFSLPLVVCLKKIREAKAGEYLHKFLSSALTEF